MAHVGKNGAIDANRAEKIGVHDALGLFESRGFIEADNGIAGVVDDDVDVSGTLKGGAMACSTERSLVTSSSRIWIGRDSCLASSRISSAFLALRPGDRAWWRRRCGLGVPECSDQPAEASACASDQNNLFGTHCHPPEPSDAYGMQMHWMLGELR